MEFARHIKIPHWLYFIFYWGYYNFVWGTTWLTALWLIRIITNRPIGFIQIWIEPIHFIMFLPMLFPIVYYKVGSKLDSVEIDEENKTIHIVYHPFIIFKREKCYSLEDDGFAYHYRFDKKSAKYWNLLYPAWTSIIYFYENRKPKILFHDVSGWKREQLEDIVKALEKYKEPTEINMYE